MLYLIGIITSSTFGRQSMTVGLDERFLPLSKAFQFCVRSDEDKRIDELEALVKKYRQEVAELKCKFFPVNVSVCRQDFDHELD